MCYIMDEPHKHPAKWKLVTKDHKRPHLYVSEDKSRQID